MTFERSGLLVLSLAGVLALPTTVSAQSVCASQAEVDAMEEEGNAFRVQHRDAEALARFEAAYARCHGARAFARIALAEAALGRWVEADAHLREALARADDPWIAANREALQRELVTITGHVGELELRGAGGAGEVLIAGERVGAWPLRGPIRVVAGSVTFTVRGEGMAPVTRTVVVPAGGIARETVTLVALSDGSVGGAPLAERGGGQRVAAWATAGGAVLLLAGGAVATALRFANHNDYFAEGTGRYTGNANCHPLERSVPQCGAIYDEGVSNDVTWAVLQGVGFGLGGALAVTSVVLFATAPSGRPAATTRVACGQGPGALGVTCGWRF